MKISVIMPVYNAEKYLHFSVGSVVEAAKRFDGETELICVDDGSTDGSGKILDEYGGKSKPKVEVEGGMEHLHSSTSTSNFDFKIIHQANAGVSAARNAGLDAATGDLVTFLDADDTYDARAFEVLFDVWQKSGAGIVRYGCNYVRDHSEDVPFTGAVDFEVIDVNDLTESLIRRCSLGWATLLPVQLAREVRWPSLTHCEDPLFVLRCLRRSPKAAFVRGMLANYLVRSDSASHTVSLDIVTATCRYLPLAYDECAAMPGFTRSRRDTCAFISGFLDGPLAKCGRDVSSNDRKAAEAAVRTARNLLAIRDSEFAKYACREQYDFAFALGSSCTATDVLRQANLQFGTFPLDWIGRLDVGTRTDFIVSGFADFLSEDRLHLETDADDGCHARYVDGKFGTAFFHDFLADAPLAETFPAVREKYTRRIARFMRQLSVAKSVLVVWISDFRDERDGINASDTALSRCLGRLASRFPGTHFSMLVFDQAAVGEPPREIRVTDGRIRRIALDYRDRSQGPESWVLRTDRLRPYLVQYDVRDYRSAAEKRDYRRREFADKRVRLHASSWLDTLVTDFQYRLFRHLQKRLTRKGVKLNEGGGTRE